MIKKPKKSVMISEEKQWEFAHVILMRGKRDHKFSIFRPPTSNAKDNFEGPNPSQMFPYSLIFLTSSVQWDNFQKLNLEKGEMTHLSTQAVGPLSSMSEMVKRYEFGQV